MIIALRSVDNQLVEAVAAVLADASFTPVNLDREAPADAALLKQGQIAWGNDFRVRLTAHLIDPLQNVLVTGIQHPLEVVTLAGIAPAGLLNMSDLLPDDQRSMLARRGIPVLYKRPTAAREPLLDAVLELSREMPRLDWDEYFMRIARIVAGRSDCVKRKVAAILVKERRIIGTGYNGTPKGTANCGDGGCPRCASFAKSGTDLGDCLCSHGEENAIIQAAYHGHSVKGATLYCTNSPCLLCTKMIINSGIEQVVYNAAYPLGGRSLELLAEAKLKVRQYGTSESDPGLPQG